MMFPKVRKPSVNVLFRLTLASSILAGILLALPPGAWADDEILIYTVGVSPPLLRTRVEERVRFVNRTGQVVHVEFPEASAQHHVFQVPDQIWAVFHGPGRHLYVVHLTDGQTGELRGIVEVQGDPRGRPDPQSCAGVTVLGTCLER